MQEYKMWIGGKFVDAESGKTYPVYNPSTEEEIARVPLAGKADVDKAVAAAKKAFPAWSEKPQAERSRILNKLADLLVEYADELGKLETIDHGSPIKGAKISGMMPSIQLREATELVKGITGKVIPWRPETLIYMQHEPIGVCALIIPWNFPLSAVCGSMAPCIAVGNTCVIKPPSVDSLPALKLAEALAKSEIPPGVVNIVTGPGSSVGEMLAAHPDIWMIGFTGSSETGKRIMELGSVNVKRLNMELGGKNPFIVLEDADLELAVETAVRVQHKNTGQICGSAGRYYLHEKIHDEFVERYVATAKKVITGDPMDMKTQMGPVVSAEHRDKLEAYIKIGIEEGAKLVLGGQRPTSPPLNKGYFVMPTAFTGVTQNMRIARDEIFGPIAIFLKFSSEENVIELANDSRYGLSADVFTKNVAKGIKMISAIQCGSGFVNDHNFINIMPWGGFKESGYGKTGTIMGMEAYTQQKVIYVDLSETKHRPWNEL